MNVTRYSHGLIDHASNAVLTIGSNAPVMSFLSECIPETQFFLSINSPNYTDSLFKRLQFASIKPEEYPQWAWDSKKRTLTKTKAAVNETLREKSRLAEGKRKLLSNVIAHLNATRSKTMPSVVFQDTIYLTKKLQAESFKKGGYDEDSILEYPYVAQYADYARISFRQAADEILLKAKLDDHHLANSELLRLKYFNKIKEASSVEQLPLILKEFRSDSFYE